MPKEDAQPSTHEDRARVHRQIKRRPVCSDALRRPSEQDSSEFCATQRPNAWPVRYAEQSTPNMERPRATSWTRPISWLTHPAIVDLLPRPPCARSKRQSAGAAKCPLHIKATYMCTCKHASAQLLVISCPTTLASSIATLPLICIGFLCANLLGRCAYNRCRGSLCGQVFGRVAPPERSSNQHNDDRREPHASRHEGSGFSRIGWLCFLPSCMTHTSQCSRTRKYPSNFGIA